MQTRNVRNSVAQLQQALEENGYSKGRILQFSSTTNQLLKFMGTNGIMEYSMDVRLRFMEECRIPASVYRDMQRHRRSGQQGRHSAHCTPLPPPTAEKQRIFEAYREARRTAEKHLAALPRKISFDRRKFAPYLDKLGSDQGLESLFLEFLRERVK